MGLWPWTINQLLTVKFWKSVKKDGFLRTYVRGHRAVRHAHLIGGRKGLVESKGQDQFGNRYYEDFDVDFRNNRRWVEYADYFLPIGIGGDRVPPGWHGWMSYQYDDTPTEELFVKHHYLKDHTPITSGTPLHNKPLGSPQNPNRMRFIMETKERKSMAWDLPSSGSRTIGKKIIAEKKCHFVDPAQLL